MTVRWARAMGCELEVGGATARELGAVRALFERYESIFSRFRPDSELSRVNACSDLVVQLSPLFAAVLRTALSAARATDGLVDPTLGSAVVAAGYDRDFALVERRPAPVATPGRPGAWTSIRLRRRMLLPRPGVELDLNGVVKALAVDEAVRLLSGRGFVSAGGDLAANGPVEVALPAGGTVTLRRGGLATSGTVNRRWLCADGTVAHHLIDPRTGVPSASPWTAVTVAGASCLAADVSAKAAFLAGHGGPRWLERRGLPGRFVAAAGAIRVNRGWAAQIDEAQAA